MRRTWHRDPMSNATGQMQLVKCNGINGETAARPSLYANTAVTAGGELTWWMRPNVRATASLAIAPAHLPSYLLSSYLPAIFTQVSYCVDRSHFIAAASICQIQTYVYQRQNSERMWL